MTSRNEAQKLSALSNSVNISNNEIKDFKPKSINQIMAECHSDTNENHVGVGGGFQTMETQIKNERLMSFGNLDHVETDYGIQNNYLPQKTNLETTENIDI